MNKEYIEKLCKVYSFAKQNMPNHPYHNFDHVEDVYKTIFKLGYFERLNEEENFVLGTTALLHDIVFNLGSKDNEEKSAELAKNYLPAVGYTAEQINLVCKLIIATKLPTNPATILEKIICDADIDNLGRRDFFEKSERIRIENGKEKNVGWYEGLLKFIQSQKYHTETARKFRDDGLKENIQVLEETIRNIMRLKNG